MRAPAPSLRRLLVLAALCPALAAAAPPRLAGAPSIAEPPSPRIVAATSIAGSAPSRLAAGSAIARSPPPRLAVVRSAEAGEPRDDVDRALAAALAGLVLPVPAEDRCRAADEPCLAALARALDAPAALHVSLRPVGGTPSLCLVRVEADPARAPTRAVEPLRPGVPVEPAVRAAVFRLLAPERVAGSLEVEATDGSEIWVDGEKRGQAPLPAIGGLAPGQHLLRVVRPGGGEARGTVEVRFEARTRVRIEPRSDELRLLAHEAAAPPPVEAAPPAAVAPAPGSAPFPIWTVAGWSAIGTGGALALGAAIPALAAARDRDDARALRDSDGRLPASLAERDRRLADRAAGHDATATALVAVGASLVASGVTVLLLDLDGDAP